MPLLLGGPPKLGGLICLALIFVVILMLSGVTTRTSATASSSFFFGTGSAEPLTGESELQFYGQSPPVYPSPIGNGSTSSGWSNAYKRARALVDQMTIEEKANLTMGYRGRCVGHTGSVPRLEIPSLCLSDGPNGVRGDEFVSAFPAGIHIAATWDYDLMYKYGKAIGEEFRGKGVNLALGPVAGPLGRIARGGRNWEGLGSDPHLAGRAMGIVVRGMQEQGVMASAKHFLLNEQEWRRRPDSFGAAISANIDDRTIHELYMYPFMEALHEGVASVMCSYQRVNNSYGCQNSKLMNGLLKTELGFEGFVVSDWSAQYTGIASANAGLDMTMPLGGYWGQNLTDAANNGSVTVERLDDMVTRILASWYYLGQDTNYPETTIGSFSHQQEPVNVQADHASLIREIGAAGTVLVKNVNNTLPFKKPTFLCIYGYDAGDSPTPWRDPLLYGGHDTNFGLNTFPGTLIAGGGSADTNPPYVVTPFQAIQDRIRQDKGILRWDLASENPYPPFANAEACLVFINAYASEKWDRTSLTDESSDRLVQNVAKNCSNTIVVIHSAGIRVVDDWIGHPNITAVLYAGLPGQESGNSLVDILWGTVNPSGRLPYTVAKNESDYGALLNSSMSFDYYPQDDFNEGPFIDYRAFDRDQVEPRFEFGFGLSYTSFNYAGAKATLKRRADTREFPDPNVPIVQGGHPALWDVVGEVSCSITNSGKLDGTEVAQLYIGFPSEEHAERPIRQLRGFQRIPLKASEKGSVVFPLTRRDLSIWDVKAQQWKLQAGAYKMYIGASSRDLRLETSLEIPTQ